MALAEILTFQRQRCFSCGKSILKQKHCDGGNVISFFRKRFLSASQCVQTPSMRKTEPKTILPKSPLKLLQGKCADPFSLTFRGLKTDQSSSSFINPLLELQKFVQVPILSEEQEVFSPSETDINQAVSIFSSRVGGSSKQAARFVGSFADGTQLPDSPLPEVCFLGRSNVGKSSLIRSLLQAHPEVKVNVSGQPGHTKTLNLYRVGRHLHLVDMPGYGHKMPSHFQQSVEAYLETSRRLCRTFLLVDSKVGLTAADHTALGMLKEFGVPYVVVLTKIDKVGRHKLLSNLMTVMEVCTTSAGHTCFSQPFLVSAKQGDGVPLLQAFIAYITGCVHIDGV